MCGVDHGDGVTIGVLAAGDEAPREQVPPQYQPTWLDFRQVSDDLADDGVAAPAQYVDGLRQVVADAHEHGLDLKLVYTEAPAGVYTQARDLATMLGQEHPGTIMVRTPLLVGSHSDTLSRATLEAGQDDAYREHDPVMSAVVFEHAVTRPSPSWGLFAGGLLLVIVLGVALLTYLIRRRSG